MQYSEEIFCETLRTRYRGGIETTGSKLSVRKIYFISLIALQYFFNYELKFSLKFSYIYITKEKNNSIRLSITL